MTESLTSLCRTLTSEGGYQPRESVPASGVYWTDRAGQGNRTQGQEGTQGHRVRKGHEVKVKVEEEEGDEIENEGNQWKRQEDGEEALGGFNVQVSTVSTLGIEFLLKGSSPRP